MTAALLGTVSVRSEHRPRPTPLRSDGSADHERDPHDNATVAAHNRGRDVLLDGRHPPIQPRDVPR